MKEKIRPHLHQYLREGHLQNAAIVEQPDQTMYKAIEEIFNEYQKVTKSTTVDQRIHQFAENYLKDHYEKKLASRRWSIRMNTLYSIERFHVASLRAHIWTLFKQMKEMGSEKQQLARILATFQCRDLLSYFYGTDEQFPLHLYKELLRRYNPSIVEELIRNYNYANERLKVAILAIIAEKKEVSHLQLVEKELESNYLDIRLQALKVIKNIGYIHDVTIITPFATSSHWQERMLFCQTSMALKKERFKPVLRELMSDSNWWVRNAAGEALSKFSDGSLILEHIMETHEDSFARDMARKWLGSDTK
ncbi:MAG: HEAT repeat domain-containing protein [Bacillaceae bacterium]|nr:HEAT repeat domain-containing protein [Bacillaceae bacterium]